MLTRRLLFIAALLAIPSAAVQATTFKIATISPDGTAWMNKLRAAAADIDQRTQGRVQFKFYPGGIMGNDQSVLRKIQVGQLQGGAVAGGSLADIYPDSQVYGFPMVFRSLDEIDYVRQRLDSQLLNGLEQHGFVTFGFAEGGFAYMMSDHALRSIADLKGQKVWIPSGDSVSETVLNVAGVSPIPLPISDVLTGLQTGLIDTLAASPIVAIALQWHTRVRYLTDAPLSYITALLVIDRKVFMTLSPGDQALVREVMGRVFKEIDIENRRDNIAAKEALRKQGIVFIQPNPNELAEWQKIADKAREKLTSRGAYSAGVLSALQGHLNAYRKAHGAATINASRTNTAEK